MSLLSPLMLLAAAALGVPLALHLLHRDRRREVIFPALRYLLRTEQDHARRIRARQALLLTLRLLAVLLLVLAGARLALGSARGGHPPTAVVVILDNSMSTQRVIEGERVLDLLKRQALAGLEAATLEDRFWVLRAADPWQTVQPLGAAGARARIAETEATDGRADLAEALRRASALLADAETEAAEIHLLSDLQRSALGSAPIPVVAGVSGTRSGAPILILTGLPEAGRLHSVAELELADGLAPLAGRRTSVMVRVDGPTDTTVSVRLYVDGEVAGVTQLFGGTRGVLTTPQVDDGWLTGWVEADADALRADNRRWFAVRTSPPPVIPRPPGDESFLAIALETLAEAQRVRLTAPGDPAASIRWSPEGVGLEGVGREGAGREGSGAAPAADVPRIVLPPRDPARLPALNRRLDEAGVSWRYETPGSVPGPLRESTVRRVASNTAPLALERLEVTDPTRLRPIGDPRQDQERVWVTLDDATPWLVTTETRAGTPVVLLAHPLDDVSSTLPVSSAMLPFVEWLSGGAGLATVGPGLEVGAALALPNVADTLVLPDGTRLAADGISRRFPTAQAGIYSARSADSVVAMWAVNVPMGESDLRTLDGPGLERVAGPAAVEVRRADWARSTFATGQGTEVWRWLAGLALLLLLVESWLAASGRTAARRSAPAATPPPVPSH